jgi:hypothetical protein
MVTWQRLSYLCSRRVIGITALGRYSLILSPFTGPPLLLLPRWRSCAFWTGAMGFSTALLPSLEASSLITFNTNITHLNDVPCSRREYRGRLETEKKPEVVEAKKPALMDRYGRLKGTGRASSATGYPPQ